MVKKTLLHIVHAIVDLIWHIIYYELLKAVQESWSARPFHKALLCGQNVVLRTSEHES